MILLVGGLDDLDDFFIYWKFHNPNWRTHIFQRGRYTTNQLTMLGLFGTGPKWIDKKACEKHPAIPNQIFPSSLQLLLMVQNLLRSMIGMEDWMNMQNSLVLFFFLVLYVCTDQKVGKHVDTITRNWVKLKLCRNRPLNSLGNKPRFLQIFPSSYPSTTISQD